MKEVPAIRPPGQQQQLSYNQSSTLSVKTGAAPSTDRVTLHLYRAAVRSPQASINPETKRRVNDDTISSSQETNPCEHVGASPLLRICYVYNHFSQSGLIACTRVLITGKSLFSNPACT